MRREESEKKKKKRNRKTKKQKLTETQKYVPVLEQAQIKKEKSQ